jgi:hypothetical protein
LPLPGVVEDLTPPTLLSQPPMFGRLAAMTGAAATQDVAGIESRATVLQFVDMVAEDADAAPRRVQAGLILASCMLARAEALNDQRIHERAPLGRQIEACGALLRRLDLHGRRWPQLVPYRSKLCPHIKRAAAGTICPEQRPKSGRKRPRRAVDQARRPTPYGV